MRIFIMIAFFYVAVWSTPIYYEFRGTVSSANYEANSYLNEEVTYLIMCDLERDAYTRQNDGSINTYVGHHSYFYGYDYFYVELISDFVIANNQTDNSFDTHKGMFFIEWADLCNQELYDPNVTPLGTTLDVLTELTMGTYSQQLYLLDDPNRFYDNPISFFDWEVGKTVDGWETVFENESKIRQIYSKLTLTSITDFNPHKVPEPTIVSLLFIGLSFLYLTSKKCHARD